MSSHFLKYVCIILYVVCGKQQIGLLCISMRHLALQVIGAFQQKTDYIQPSPPGCPLEMYRIMVMCWYVCMPIVILHAAPQEEVQKILCQSLFCPKFCSLYRSFDHHSRPSFEAIEELLKKDDSDLLKVASTTATSDETCSA